MSGYQDEPVEDEVAVTDLGAPFASLERLQDLMRISTGIIGNMALHIKSPQEAQFVIAHVKDAVDHWQPGRQMDGQSK